jgi:hypothetical protein
MMPWTNQMLMKITSALTASFIIFTFFSQNAYSQADREQQLVYAAIEDYVDGLYLVQPERIRKSVHRDLTKKGYWRKSNTEPFGPEQTMTWQQLYDLAGKWNSQGKLSKDAPKKIEVFDVQDQTASAKLTAEWGTDYFHLAKYDGKWMIINVLWQSPPSQGSSGQ